MRVSDFKYILLEIGGGWQYMHELYGITVTGEIYHTSDFPREVCGHTELEMCFAGKMEESDVFFEPPEKSGIWLDCPTYHLLEPSDSEPDGLKLLYSKEDNHVPLIEKLHKVTYYYDHEQNIKKSLKSLNR